MELCSQNTCHERAEIRYLLGYIHTSFHHDSLEKKMEFFRGETDHWIIPGTCNHKDLFSSKRILLIYNLNRHIV